MKKQQKNILIVEDDKSTGSALKQKLEAEGYKTVVTQNGEECVSFLKENKPDLILLDMVMPVMDGLETLKQIRANEDTKNLSVIVLTNINSNEKVAEVLKNGAQDYLIKTDQTLESIVEHVKVKLN